VCHIFSSGDRAEYWTAGWEWSIKRTARLVEGAVLGGGGGGVVEGRAMLRGDSSLMYCTKGRDF
jgi:hypothetical protein